MSCFFFDFWVALGAPGDGLTCNPYAPAQSKHTFLFLHFSKNNVQTMLFWLHFGSYCQQKSRFWVNKKGSKNSFKKRVPPRRKRDPKRSYEQARRLPDSPPYVFDCSNKKQQFEQEITTAAQFWVHFWILVLESVISESMFGKLFICCLDLLFLFQRLVIWHALGQGPANLV